jgi:hypothetical protein
MFAITIASTMGSRCVVFIDVLFGRHDPEVAVDQQLVFYTDRAEYAAEWLNPVISLLDPERSA